MWATGIASGLGQIMSIIWLPMQSAALVLLYYDLRVRGESYDLALRIEQMEGQTPPPAPPVGGRPDSEASLS
jgi:hypothetical protein